MGSRYTRGAKKSEVNGDLAEGLVPGNGRVLDPAIYGNVPVETVG